jgi:hypothetical protein
MSLLMETWRQYLNEEEAFRTIGDLRRAVHKIASSKKAGRSLNVAKDLAVGAVLGAIPGASTIKSLFDLVKPLYSQPDDKKTNTALDKLNIDDEISAIVDDTIEDNFLKDLSQSLEKLPDETPLESVDMTQELAQYIAKKYNKRTVFKPGAPTG